MTFPHAPGTKTIRHAAQVCKHGQSKATLQQTGGGQTIKKGDPTASSPGEHADSKTAGSSSARQQGPHQRAMRQNSQASWHSQHACRTSILLQAHLDGRSCSRHAPGVVPATHLWPKVHAHTLGRPATVHAGQQVLRHLAVTVAQRLVDKAVCEVRLRAPGRAVMV